MTSLIGWIAGVPSWLLLVLVFGLPAAEASLFVGLAIPGETIVLLGGAAAHAGKVSLAAVIIAAAAGAIVGDQIGFVVGRRYGNALLRRLPRRLQGSGRIDSTLTVLRNRGAVAVFLGRWAAALRALVPGLAGMSGMGRTRFTLANVGGGVLWASAVALAGYLAGASYQALESRLGYAGDGLVLLVVLMSLAWVVHRRHAARHAAST
jgi:membrane-associated protein